MIFPQYHADELIRRALAEDVNYLDISSAFLFDENSRSAGVFRAKADGVLCGIDIALRVFEILDSAAVFEKYKNDGEKVFRGDVLARVECRTAFLLQGERTALNLLQHLSGIATYTRQCVDALEGTGACLADTRKTLPGMRAVQKYAVLCGGGRNHRYNLSDAVMLKDNHIDAGGGIEKTVRTVREHIGHTLTVEVEVRNLEEVQQAVEAEADIIMLDNMTADEMREAVAFIDGRAVTEASGGITIDTIREIALTGVNIISSGALTHSVKALDISMKIEK